MAYLAYLSFIVQSATAIPVDEEMDPGNGLGMSVFRLLMGLVIVGFSAELTVDGATKVATTLGVEQAFVAIVIIGLGSSLPELSISLGAAMEKRVMLSVGNLLGSNVFDTVVPIGVAAVIAGLDFNRDLLMQELPFLFVLTVIVLALFLRKGIRKREGAVVLGLYVAYVIAELIAARQ
jgi:cation:H+ antiporter